MIDELSPEARAVIAAGLRAERPTAADRARVRAALDARLAAESSRVLPRSASLALGVAVFALVAFGVWWATRPVPAPPPRPQTAPSVVAPVVAAPPVPSVPAAPSTPPAGPSLPAATPAPSRPRPQAPARDDADTLAEEMRLLGIARRAWADRHDVDAQRALSEHRRRFPRGVLTEEREATELLVRCGRGDADTAARVAAFVRRFPASPQRPRVERACAAGPE